MNYPTLTQVEAADHAQLLAWLRGLSWPGVDACYAGLVNNEEYEEIHAHESAIITRIGARAMEFDLKASITTKDLPTT